MPIPTADDYALAEIDVLASSILNKCKIMRYAGKGAAAMRHVQGMRADLRGLLQDMVDKSMEFATRCQSMTEAIELPRERRFWSRSR
jgi:hypothetical protein